MNEITTRQQALAIEIHEDEYMAAMATWLQGRSKNTRRSYFRAIQDFLAFAGVHPAEVRPPHVAAWKESLRQAGRSDSTIAQRLSAISSYFAFLQRPQADGLPLMPFNPVAGVDRDDLDVNPYANARKLSADEFKAIMSQIDTSSANGARDAAMLLFYVYTGRRRSEVINLYGRDIRQTNGDISYRARMKGGKVEWMELPPPVWQAIQHYLHVAGRELSPDKPIFVALVDNAQYLNEWRGFDSPDEEQPISGDAVSQALKRYANRAGIEPDAVSVHSIRHLAAELFQRASGDIRETQRFLGHAHVNTTQIYMEQLTGQKHRHWQAMMNQLAAA